jgi:hypothetical protein
MVRSRSLSNELEVGNWRDPGDLQRGLLSNHQWLCVRTFLRFDRRGYLHKTTMTTTNVMTVARTMKVTPTVWRSFIGGLGGEILLGKVLA